MKILYTMDMFHPSQAGGPANTVYWIVKNLPEDECERVVVATNLGLKPDVPLNKWIYADGFRRIYVKNYTRLLPIRHFLLTLRTMPQVDIVQFSSIFFPSAFLTAMAARLLGKKIVWSPKGELDPPALAFALWRKRPVLWMVRRLLGAYPVFQSTCAAETAYVKQVLGGNVKVAEIPNYMEVPALVTRTASNYLLFIGRVHPKKGIENLLRALTTSESFLRSDFDLKVAGLGPKDYADSLVKLVSDLGLQHKVEFIGQVEGDEKERILANAYFTIMPSHTENFGIVVIESLAQSTPAIASKGTPWESLEKGRVGFWVDNSPSSLAETIEIILNMPEEEYQGYRKRSRPFVEREFDIKKNIGKWVELYRSL
jgi:glycosyltransferase involved in cell wall biosynthesis